MHHGETRKEAKKRKLGEKHKLNENM